MFRLEIKKKAFKVLEKVAPSHNESIRGLFQVLKKDPIPYHDFDLAKLGGSANWYRVRVGDLRVIYSIDWKEKVITVSRIQVRGRAY